MDITFSNPAYINETSTSLNKKDIDIDSKKV